MTVKIIKICSISVLQAFIRTLYIMMNAIKKVLKSIIFSFHGVLELFKTNSFIYEFLFFIFWLLYALLSGFKNSDILTVILFLLLFAFEALNTCVELICDKINPSYCDVVRVIKDMASAAVFFVILSILIQVLFYAQ